VFIAAFLLRTGVPAPLVLASMAAIFAGRFCIRPAILPLARRFGLKPLVVLGSLLGALQYVVLAGVHGLGWPLAAAVLAAAAGDTLYWTTYHAYFASLGDSDHRGHQIGAREALAATVGVIAPLATGLLLTRFGPYAAFWTTALMLAFSALPLIATPNVAVAASAPGSLRASQIGMRLFAVDGWTGAGFFYVWQIALFLTLRENFAAFGGAMAVAALVGAGGGLILGRWIDRGHGVRAMRVAIGALTLVVALRAASQGAVVLAVAANAAGAVVTAIYTPTLMTAVYNQAAGSPCILRFHMATEAGYDAGCTAGCLAAAALLWAGAPIALVLLLPLIGAAAMYRFLGRYYGALGSAQSATSAVRSPP